MSNKANYTSNATSIIFTKSKYTIYTSNSINKYNHKTQVNFTNLPTNKSSLLQKTICYRVIVSDCQTSKTSYPFLSIGILQIIDCFIFPIRTNTNKVLHKKSILSEKQENSKESTNRFKNSDQTVRNAQQSAIQRQSDNYSTAFKAQET